MACSQSIPKTLAECLDIEVCQKLWQNQMLLLPWAEESWRENMGKRLGVCSATRRVRGIPCVTGAEGHPGFRTLPKSTGNEEIKT